MREWRGWWWVNEQWDVTSYNKEEWERCLNNCRTDENEIISLFEELCSSEESDKAENIYNELRESLLPKKHIHMYVDYVSEHRYYSIKEHHGNYLLDILLLSANTNLAKQIWNDFDCMVRFCPYDFSNREDQIDYVLGNLLKSSNTELVNSVYGKYLENISNECIYLNEDRSLRVIQCLLSSRNHDFANKMYLDMPLILYFLSNND